MSVVSVEKLPDENIVVVTYEPPFDANVDVSQVQAELEAIHAEGDGALYVVGDLSRVTPTVQDLVDSINYTVMRRPVSMRNPDIHLILVGEGSLLELAARSYAHTYYGSQHVPVFKTVDAALAYVRRR